MPEFMIPFQSNGLDTSKATSRSLSLALRSKCSEKDEDELWEVFGAEVMHEGEELDPILHEVRAGPRAAVSAVCPRALEHIARSEKLKFSTKKFLERLKTCQRRRLI